jgi:hypothetical protein
MIRHFLAIIISAWLCFNVFAAEQEVFRVLSMKGKVDFIAQTAAERPLSVGVFLRPNSKLILSPGSQISLLGPKQETIHFAGQSSVELLPYGVQLRYGSMWISSDQEAHNLYVESPNGMVQFKRMEGIITYDTVLKKTQIFVITGNAQIANAYIPDKRENLVSGEISFVQRDFQQGLPRKPSLIGKDSMYLLLSQFKGIDSRSRDKEFQSLLAQLTPPVENGVQENKVNAGRGIASIGPQPQDSNLYVGDEQSKKPKIMFIPKNMKRMLQEISKSKRSIASISSSKNATAVARSMAKRKGTEVRMIKVEIKNFRAKSVKQDERTPSSEVPKITAPMQSNDAPPKQVDYLRNPSSTTASDDRVPVTTQEKATTDRELNQLMEQLQRVGQDQNEHY